MPDRATATPLPGVRALFQQRLSGDDALLRLAERRFREAGMPAEVYAENRSAGALAALRSRARHTACGPPQPIGRPPAAIRA